MKRLILNTVLLSIAITVGAQTSRRESSQTKSNDNNTTYQRTESSTSGTSTERSSSTTKRESSDVKKNTGNNSSSQTRTETRSNTTNNNDARSRDAHSEPVRRTTESNRDYTRTDVKSGSNTTRVYHTDKVYRTPETHVRRVYVESPRHHHTYTRVEYRSPVSVHVVWDAPMYRDYCVIYPFVREWRISVGTRIETISAYDAIYYIGDVKRVYGLVREVYYEPRNDEYQLYIGDYYPNQDFTVIIPGYIARQYSRRPQRFFQHQYIWTTGYITEFDNKPEMIIQRDYQIGIY